MKKWLILIFIILFATIVIADKGQIETYKPREIFDLGIHLSNDTGDVLGALCQIQIRNESYEDILSATLNEIGGGWYNYTYNTSKTGKYFCRQNCTYGTLFAAETCDFIIKGDENMPIAVILTLALIVFVYLWFIRSLNQDILSQHGLIKSAIFLFVFWFLLIPLNIQIESMGNEGATTSMISMISVVHTVMIYLNLVLTAYFIIYLIVSFARSINENVQK